MAPRSLPGAAPAADPPAQKMGRKISAQMPPANAPAILNFLKMWYTVL